MARVFPGQRTWLDPVLRPVERLIYRLTGVDERARCAGPSTPSRVLLFSVVSMLGALRDAARCRVCCR